MRISDWSSDVCSSDLPGGQSEDFLFRGIDVRQDNVDRIRSFRQEHQRLCGAGRLQHVIAARPQELREWVPKQNVRLKNKDVRSEESRVGKECVSPCRSRGSPDN